MEFGAAIEFSYSNRENLSSCRMQKKILVELSFYEDEMERIDFRWISKKLHIGGVQFFYYFGVLEYVVMIEKL